MGHRETQQGGYLSSRRCQFPNPLCFRSLNFSSDLLIGQFTVKKKAKSGKLYVLIFFFFLMAGSRERRLQAEKAAVGVCLCHFPFLCGYNRAGPASGLGDSSCWPSDQVRQRVLGGVLRTEYTGTKG